MSFDEIPIEALPGPACLIRSGAIAAHNAAFSAWVGRDDAVGAAVEEVFPGDAPMVRLHREAIDVGAPAEHHFARRGADGAQSFWSIRAARTGDDVLLWAVDVGSFVHAAQAVHAAQHDHVALAAHELRSPLAAIKTWASAASNRRSELVDPMVGEALQVIGRQVDRIQELLVDLLDVARSDAGALRAARVEADVEALVHRALAASPHAGRVTVPTQLPGRALVDPLHFESIVGKLLAHVARRQRSGAIAIASVELARPIGDRESSIDEAWGRLDAPEEIHVVVVDRGPLPSARAWDETFARFSRASRKNDGGLGLYLCQQLAAVNGGRVWLEQADGALRFVLALRPARQRPSITGCPPASQAIAAFSQAADSSPPPSLGRRDAPLRILLADRDAALLGRAASVLRLQGHELAVASRADALWHSLDAMTFDVVVLDPGIPGLDGIGAIRRIRDHDPNAPAVIVTTPSAERPEALRSAERAGAQAVLPKPFDWTHLLALVRAASIARG